MPSAVPPTIAALSAEAASLRDLLIHFCDTNSGSSHTAGLARMAALLRDELCRLTPDVSLIPVGDGARCALRARCRPSAPIQVLCSGHYDTVYDEKHPFQRCTLTDAQTINGPGVADMKGGIVVMLAALRAFEATPSTAQIGWTVLLTPDEETGSEASRTLIESMVPKHQIALVFEPGRETGNLVRSRKGTGGFSIIAHGRAAHAGREPREGANAIVALSEFLIGADAINREISGALLNVGSISGGGPVNVVPDLARAEIGVRVARKTDADRVRHLLQHIADKLSVDGIRFDITGGFDRLPMESGPVSEKLFVAYQDCAATLGLAPFDWVHTGGGSDGNLLSAAGLPVLDGLGIVGGALHSNKEWALLPSLTERAQAAALLLHRLATGETSIG